MRGSYEFLLLNFFLHVFLIKKLMKDNTNDLILLISTSLVAGSATHVFTS